MSAQGNEEELVPEVITRSRKRQAEQDTVVLSTGVKIRIKPIAAMLLADILAELEKQKPKVPVVLIESKGRTEENPADPDYIRSLEAFEARTASAFNDVMIVEGTELISAPKTLGGPDDPGFLERMSVLGRPIGSGVARYLVWMKYVAAPRTEDIALIIGEVGRKSGVSEDDVQTAARHFRGEDRR